MVGSSTWLKATPRRACMIFLHFGIPQLSNSIRNREGRGATGRSKGATGRYKVVLLVVSSPRKLPPPPESVDIVSYADDSTLMARNNGISNLCRRLNSYLSILAAFFSNRNLKISPTKSSATLITTWTKEVSLQLAVEVGGQRIPTVIYPKILGVTSDSLHREGLEEKYGSIWEWTKKPC